MDPLDAIVIGGGPAGATAGRRLAEAGARVLILEKGPLGRDKPCGGGLTSRAWRALDVDVATTVRSVVTHADVRYGTEHRALIPLGSDVVRMVLRRDFDRVLVDAAADAGARVHTGETAVAVEMDARGATVSTARASYRSRFLVIATGGEGALRSAAGLPVPRSHPAPAIEIEAPVREAPLDANAVILDFAIPDGYAWVFPKGEVWNVGVVSTNRSVGPRLRSLLGAFLRDIGIVFEVSSTSRAVTGRRIPMWHGATRMYCGHAVAVGDAGGFADPLFGEGITQALLSGRWAADAVVVALGSRSGDLSPVEARVGLRTVSHLRRMRVIARGAYAHPALSVRVLHRSRTVRRLARRVAFVGPRTTLAA